MNKYYVYRFLDKDNNIIYIGKTKDIYSRINTHFSRNGHLTEECYNSVISVQFASFDSHIDMDIYEMYLIDTIRPKYNTQFIYSNQKTKIVLDEPNFVSYDRIIKVEQKDRKKYLISSDRFKNNEFDITKQKHIIDNIRYKVITSEFNVTLSKRDFYIFKFILENQNCTVSDISHNLFNKSLRSAQHRMKKLCNVNFISSKRRDILSEKEYYITTDNLSIYKKAINSIKE